MLPDLGFGLGLRPDHYEAILSDRPDVDFFEALTENYLVAGGKPLDYLHRIRSDYPIVLHGVSLSIGSTAPLNRQYLDDLQALVRRIEPAWISDHLCWTGVDGVNLHDLMPLPYTQAALDHLVPRIREVQDRLGRRILLENVSSYVSYRSSEMTEWEFLARLSEAADCLLLLDINNVYVNSVNHRFDPDEFVRGINQRLGKDVIVTVPVGQAAVALRKKIAAASGGDSQIETVWGGGYMLRDGPETRRVYAELQPLAA